MEEVRKSLTTQERELLADLWEEKSKLHSLQKVLLQRQFNLAITTIATAPDWENVTRNRGEIDGSKWVNSFLKFNYDKVVTARNKAHINDKSA